MTPAEKVVLQLDGDTLAGSSVYEVIVHGFMKNFLGKAMHGGAIAAAVEEACYLHHMSQTGTGNKEKQQGYIKSMDVCYLSPSKGTLLITALDDPFSPNPCKTMGKVLDKKDNSVCCEFTCHWAKT